MVVYRCCLTRGWVQWGQPCRSWWPCRSSCLTPQWGGPSPPAHCLRRAARCSSCQGRSVVQSGVLNSFLTVTISVCDSSHPRIASAGVGSGCPNGDSCVLLVVLQPLLFLVQPLRVLLVTCSCCQGFGECLPVLTRELPPVSASLPTAGARLELPCPFPQGWEGLGGNR